MSRRCWWRGRCAGAACAAIAASCAAESSEPWSSTTSTVSPEIAARARDLASPGEKAEDLSRALAQGCLHRRGQRHAWRVANLERMRRTGHVDDRATAQIRRHRRGVERRRHDDETKIAAREPGLLRERDAEIGVHAALVELVEDDGPEIPEERILLQARGQDALGREEHRRLWPELALEPDVPPDFPADRPALFVGDARRQAARGDAPRLENDHRPVHGERGRHAGRLARLPVPRSRPRRGIRGRARGSRGSTGRSGGGATATAGSDPVTLAGIRRSALGSQGARESRRLRQ